MNWLSYIAGIAHEGGNAVYDVTSGPLGALEIAAGFALFLVHHNCHSKRCWRLARHPAADGTFRICTYHFKKLPGNEGRGHITFERIVEHHQAHLDRQKVTSE